MISYAFLFQTQLYDKFKEFREMNNNLSQKQCEDLLRKIFQTLEHGKTSDRYSAGHGYIQYLSDMESLRDSYVNTPNKGFKVS